MNRIILIGNGFDLAHGLKTSYKDFIDWFWENQIKKYNSSYSIRDMGLFNLNNQYFKFNTLPPIPLGVNSYSELTKKYSITFKNRFLELISEESHRQKWWVDIEDEYYKFLVLCSKDNDFETIRALNKDLEDIKNELINYLKTQKNKNIITDYDKIMFGAIDPKDFTDEEAINSIKKEMYSNSLKWKKEETEKEFTYRFDEYMEFVQVKSCPNNYSIENYPYIEEKEFAFPKFTLFLNFNYTNTFEKYIALNKIYKSDYPVYIHGSLSIPQNPIIFGYGDEIDDDYKILEKKSVGKNFILENMKSVYYSKTDNYNRVLHFINSDLYQIIILGHSCGNSDRTLLNKLFEHKNCVSIKPCYYIDKNGKNDYTDKYINISRNFNDKNLLRERVVNETYCDAMPQLEKS